MNSYRNLLTLILFIFFSSQSPAISSQWVITINGYGSISEGQSVKEAEKLLGTKLYNHNPYPNASDEDCSYYSTSSNNKSPIIYMVKNKKIIRIEISQNNISTDKGARIGDTQETLKKVYGNALEWGNNRYDDLPIAYLWKNKQDLNGIKFDIEHTGIIETITVGKSLFLSEGCN